ncbi:hypothetical protein O3M35_006580 [Rhynocoris fuscipes]|uniref:Uncharacterized protein n=1 Tax=Rhynocoris fuscipes TaxID=488301 RepID=A0AAW1DGK3_9HEMI
MSVPLSVTVVLIYANRADPNKLARDPRRPPYLLTDVYGTGGRTSPATTANSTTTAGLASPTLWRANQAHRHSTPSLQSTSLQCR